jgi:hypothetical protein
MSKPVNGLNLVLISPYRTANCGTKICRGRVLSVNLVKLPSFIRIMRTLKKKKENEISRSSDQTVLSALMPQFMPVHILLYIMYHCIYGCMLLLTCSYYVSLLLRLCIISVTLLIINIFMYSYFYVMYYCYVY